MIKTKRLKLLPYLVHSAVPIRGVPWFRRIKLILIPISMQRSSALCPLFHFPNDALISATRRSIIVISLNKTMCPQETALGAQFIRSWGSGFCLLRLMVKLLLKIGLVCHAWRKYYLLLIFGVSPEQLQNEESQLLRALRVSECIESDRNSRFQDTQDFSIIFQSRFDHKLLVGAVTRTDLPLQSLLGQISGRPRVPNLWKVGLLAPFRKAHFTYKEPEKEKEIAAASEIQEIIISPFSYQVPYDQVFRTGLRAVSG